MQTEKIVLTHIKYNKMTKADIVHAIAERTGLERQAILIIVEEMMSTIKQNMADGENVPICVVLAPLRLFIVPRKPARNISKNTTVIVPEHNIPKFKTLTRWLVCICSMTMCSSDMRSS